MGVEIIEPATAELVQFSLLAICALVLCVGVFFLLIEQGGPFTRAGLVATFVVALGCIGVLVGASGGIERASEQATAATLAAVHERYGIQLERLPSGGPGRGIPVTLDDRIVEAVRVDGLIVVVDNDGREVVPATSGD